MDSTGLDAMAPLPGEMDDLDNLFEFGDIDLNNIPDADGFGAQMQQQHQQQQHPGTHPSTPFLDMSQAPPMPDTSAHDFGGHEQFAMAQQMGQQQQQQAQQQHLMGHGDLHGQTSMPFTTEGMYQPSLQQVYHAQMPQGYLMQSQQGFPTYQQIVPPTPNSFEMHGMAARFMQQQQLDPQHRAILEQRYGMRKEDVAFTPMVSPAGTPQFNIMPEFTTPGAYFSPLTSPMLHAQNMQQQHQMQQHQLQQGYLTNPSTAPSSNTDSPIDRSRDMDMGDVSMNPASTGPRPRKSGRRKIATAKGAGAAGSKATQSTGPRAQQKRKSSSQMQKNGDDLSLRAVQSQPMPGSLHMPSHTDSSEVESISPEPLSESLMGPPPRPGSSTTSPALAGQHQAVASAATPKSLLTMRGAHPSNGGQNTGQSMNSGPADVGELEDLSLPESATRAGHSLPQIDTQIAMSAMDEDTPRLSARKTPKLGPSSTPTSARPHTSQSPMIGSPMSASTPSAILNKKDSKHGRGPKKRSSTSSSKLVSPALVPKISPSIKPLLPEGTPLNTATQAMLLASKSNYQNLLEGNRLPGVNYPDSLSTGLTSKRTSHKVAEQGRRNRINEALKEMQSLIPKAPSTNGNGRPPNTPAMSGDVSSTSPAAAEEDERPDENGGVNGAKQSQEDALAKSNSSKAATVELANEYIKRMQKQQASQEERIERLEREKEELERKLRGASEETGEAVEA